MIFIYLLCLIVLAESGVDDFTDLSLNLMSIYNGEYNNKEQHQQSKEHAFIQFKILPVYVRDIGGPTWYFEWAVDGVVILVQVGDIYEGNGGNIYLQLYNFTDIRALKYGQFNVSKMAYVTQDQLSGHGCEVVFKRLTTNVYAGYWHECRFAIRGAPVYYTELAVEGDVQTMLLGAVYERPGPTIEVKLYNFTNPSLFKPGEFDVSTLYNLKKEQLSGGNCTAIVKRLSRTTYVGSFPDCKNSIEGNNSSYGDTFVCNRNGIVFPPTVPGYSKTPYIFDRTGNRESTASFPDTFDRICGQPGQVTRRYK